MTGEEGLGKMRTRIVAERVAVKAAAASEDAELVELLRRSAEAHRGWVVYPKTVDGVRTFRRSVADEGGVLFVCRLRSTGELVGLLHLTRIVRGAYQTAEVGCAVGGPFVGRGYLTEALGAVARWAMSEFGLHRLEALVDRSNRRSQRMLRRIGFRFEGVARSAVAVDGARADQERWAVIPEDLTQAPAASMAEASERRDDHEPA